MFNKDYLLTGDSGLFDEWPGDNLSLPSPDRIRTPQDQLLTEDELTIAAYRQFKLARDFSIRSQGDIPTESFLGLVKDEQVRARAIEILITMEAPKVLIEATMAQDELR